MIIDTHCHIDLYNTPELTLKECEAEGITVLAMTNLPSHFERGLPFFRNQKKIRLALGLHPLYSERHKKEFPLFLKNFTKTSYIGEIGLDFSREGIRTKDLQVDTFSKILDHSTNSKKLLSLHSRRAEKSVLELLVEYKIDNAIFHWYTGSRKLISQILEAGYYFSINPAMIKSENGRKILSEIPIEKILTESDGPFVKVKNRIIHPRDIKIITDYISHNRGLNEVQVEKQISDNFKKLINKIK